jgi:chemotaxis protein MotB
MKNLVGILGLIWLVSCVPVKKYRELEANYNKCMEEQAMYKSKYIDYENQVKELNVQLETMRTDLAALVADTTDMGREYRALGIEHARALETNQALEKKYAETVTAGSAETARLINELETTRIELQKKEDRLNELEEELNARSRALDEKEKRINELESIIAAKDEAVRLLKEKITAALRGFADKGITVEERDGRIYVSMEAQLLFASGKTDVNKEGQTALINLAKVLETQSDIDILVEGHTDIDPMNSATSPKDNWELSVLRATSVVKIMLGNSNMDPTRITAAGRSEYVPVDPANKAKNRRIEIIIIPDLSKLFELISS